MSQHFVALTSSVSNATLHINAAYIVGFYYDAVAEHTVVTVRGERDEVAVKESPEAILSVVGGRWSGDGERGQLSRTY